MRADRVFCRATSDVFHADIGDALVILNTKRGFYHDLNPVAAAIWNLLAAPITEDQIIETLLARFEVDKTTCRTAVHAFLEKLDDRGLLAQEATCA